MKDLWLVMLSMLVALLWMSGRQGASAAVLDLRCVPDDWQVAAQGKSTAHFDRREICRINHPWETSEAGDYGEISRMVTIPEEWAGPFWLRWYCSDNYVGEGVDRTVVGEGRTGIVMIGHRFKQVLVDDLVIWERDVADPIFPGEKTGALEPAGGDDPFPSYFCVDISPYVTAGRPFRLALRILDKVASTERLDRDWRAEFRWYDKPVEMANTTFGTDVYWADVTLHQGAKPPVVRARPSWRPKLRPIRLRGGEPIVKQSVPMALERAELLTDKPFPVSCGIPFPEGAIATLKLVLTDPDGQELPVQGQAFLNWPDGSVKWARIDFLACRPQSETGKWTLTFGTDVQPIPVPDALKVEEGTDAVVVDTGAIKLVVNRVGEDLIDSVTLAGREEPLSSSINNSMFVALPTAQEDGTIVDRWANLKARKETVAVEAEGPLRVTLKITGHISDGGDAVLGRFVTRIEAYAGQPYLKVYHRIFNDYPAPSVRIRQFQLQIPISSVKPQEAEQVRSVTPGMYGTGRPPAGIFARFGNETPVKELSEVEPEARQRVGRVLGIPGRRRGVRPSFLAAVPHGPGY